MDNAANLTSTEHKTTTANESSTLPADTRCQQPLRGLSDYGQHCVELAWADTDDNTDPEPPCTHCDRPAWDHPDGHCHGSDDGYTPAVQLPADLHRRAAGLCLEHSAAAAEIRETTGRRIYEMRIAWGSDYSAELDAAARELSAASLAAIAELDAQLDTDIAALYALADWRERAEAAAIADGGPGLVAAAAQYRAHLERPHTRETLILISHRWGRRLRRWTLNNAPALAAEITGPLAAAMGHTPAVVRAQARGELKAAGIYQPVHRRGLFVAA